MNIPDEQLKSIGDSMNVDWNVIPFDQFRKGVNTEMSEHGAEHKETDVVDHNPNDAAKIAYAHLKEMPDYYDRLASMEEEGKEDMGSKEDTDKPDVSDKEETPTCGKLRGGGLIHLLERIVPMIFDLKNQLPTDMDENPFDFLEDDDFDDKDVVVKKFKDDHGGVKGVIKIVKMKSPDMADTFASMLSDLCAVRKSEKLNSYRQVFAHINMMKKEQKIAKHQLEATAKVEDLMGDAEDAEEFSKLAAIKESILKSTDESLDVAAYRTRDIFASYVPKANIRLAYTYLVTQDGEPYQECPKARYQTGVAKPMEISKCRDNCIDSRTTTEGKTVCAYAEWLRIADNQNAVNERLEVHRNPDNDETLLNLKQGERTKKASYNEKNYEQRLEEIRKEKEVPEKAVESRLDDASEAELGHHGENKESIPDYLEKKEKIPEPQKRQAGKGVDKIDPEKDDTLGEQIADSQGEELGDETIEEMLADKWSGLSDEDLDETVEMLLRQIKYTGKPPKKGK
jgi:hypothetical protein